MAFSLFVKKKDNDFVQIGMYKNSTNWNVVKFNIATGEVLHSGNAGDHSAPTNATITSYGNGWYRISAVFASTVTASTEQVYIACTPTSEAPSGAFGLLGGWTGVTTENVYAYGAQAENNASFPTSYIPCYGTSATRTADDAVVNYTEISDTGGTLFYQGFADIGTDSHLIALSNSSGATGNNRVLLYRSTSDKKVWLYVQSAGASVKNISLELPTDANDKYAVAWATNDFAVYINGVQEYTSSTGAIPTGMQYLQLNEWSNVHEETNIVKQVLYFPNRLSNSDLATLTSL